jgi:MoaA/NifB/PqqE/SkfB family radical SAM enzyme
MQQLATLARLKGKLSPVTVNPTAAFIEATSHCQLRCPSCPTALKKTDAVLGRGYLTPDRLMRILEAGPKIRHVELSNWGEAFLNPRLPEILRILHQRGIRITIANGANLNNARDEALEAVVRYRVSNITCSIDGASSETYKEYRRGGDFNKVMENIRKINEYKSRHRSKCPKLSWQFVIFGHNQHEIDKARMMAKELNMDIQFKLSWEWDPNYSPVTNTKSVVKAVGATSRKELLEKYGVEAYNGICMQLWNRPAINWDGTVVGCCANFWGAFSNINTEGSFKAAVNSERMQYARKMLMGKAESREDIPCTRCSRYEHRLKTGQWITPADVYLLSPLRRILREHGLTPKIRSLLLPGRRLLIKFPIFRRALFGDI